MKRKITRKEETQLTSKPHSIHQPPRFRLHTHNLPQPIQQPLRWAPFPISRRSMDGPALTNAYPRLGSGAKAR